MLPLQRDENRLPVPRPFREHARERRPGVRRELVPEVVDADGELAVEAGLHRRRRERARDVLAMALQILMREVRAAGTAVQRDLSAFSNDRAAHRLDVLDPPRAVEDLPRFLPVGLSVGVERAPDECVGRAAADDGDDVDFIAEQILLQPRGGAFADVELLLVRDHEHERLRAVDRSAEFVVQLRPSGARIRVIERDEESEEEERVGHDGRSPFVKRASVFRVP